MKLLVYAATLLINGRVRGYTVNGVDVFGTPVYAPQSLPSRCLVANRRGLKSLNIQNPQVYADVFHDSLYL